MIPLPLNLNQLVTLTVMMAEIGIPYKWGGKDNPLGHQLHELKETGLDCSGFVKTAVWRTHVSGTQPITLPDGSLNIRDWFAHHGYPEVFVKDGHRMDGALRGAWLPPKGKEPAHIMLILDGETLECCGDHGVCRREWGSEPFMHECEVYLLTLPTKEV